MTNEQEEAAWNKVFALADAVEKINHATYEELKQAYIDVIEWQYEQDKWGDIDWKSAYDAEVVRHAELKAELDALKAEYTKAQQQLAEYRQTLAELSKTNSKLVKDIAALSVCGYRCAKIEDTYKCGHNDNFGNPCDIENCNIR